MTVAGDDFEARRPGRAEALRYQLLTAQAQLAALLAERGVISPPIRDKLADLAGTVRTFDIAAVPVVVGDWADPDPAERQAACLEKIVANLERIASSLEKMSG